MEEIQITIPAAVWAAACDFCAGKDVRYYLQCIHVGPKFIESSDGRKAFRWTHGATVPDETDALLAAVKMPAGSRGQVTVLIGDGRAQVRRHPFTVDVSPHMDDAMKGRILVGGSVYPNMDAVFSAPAKRPEEAGKPCDGWNPRYLQQICKHLSAIANDEQIREKYPVLNIVTNGEMAATIITSPMASLASARIALMPMRG